MTEHDGGNHEDGAGLTASAEIAFPAPLDTLSAREQALLAAESDRVSYPKGACLFLLGSEGDSLYVLQEGVVRLEVEPEEVHSEAVLGFLSAGQILGEMAFLDRQPRSASAYAQEPVKALRIPIDRIERLGQSHPDVTASLYRALGRSVSAKLRQSNVRVAGLLHLGRDPEIDQLVADAGAAQRRIEALSDQQLEELLKDIAESVAVNAEELAEATVEATHLGNAPDKAAKNRLASVGVYRWLFGRPGAGLLRSDPEAGVVEFGSPVGVVFGVIPQTSPVATAIFKTLICLKSRNSLILSFHRSAQRLAEGLGAILHAALERHGAPREAVQWVRTRNSRRKTELLMRHPGVGLILATGGSSLVRAAYSSGKPAIGVGPGNVPVLVCADADAARVAESVIDSKSYDNGLICGAESHLIVEEQILPDLVAALESRGGAVLSPREKESLSAEAFRDGHLAMDAIGQAAEKIARVAGIARDRPIRLLIVPVERLDPGDPLTREKLAPIVSLVACRNFEDGLARCLELLEIEGKGHTAVIHTADDERIRRFAGAIPASRILANSPASHGVVGYTSGLVPSLTLGCGTLGGNSTTDNVTYTHLLNIKRLAYGRPARHDIVA